MRAEVMTSKHPGRRWFPTMCGTLLAACALGLPPRSAGAASISEPATVFYGRITGTGSAQPFPITEGTLEWALEASDGKRIRLSTPIRPIKDSGFAYRLNVPHHVLAAGMNPAGPGLPLKAASESHRHLEVRVNGQPAVLAGPSGASFDASQARRAATFLLDLEVPLSPADGDSDGLPDWWQAQHQLTGGAPGDADADGVSNLDEYRLGTDPNRANREPTLRTTSFLAYADGTTGVVLDVVDTDTAPAGLGFTLTRPPAVGELRLRNAVASPAAPDRVLTAGARFTQADVLGGRLIYVHPGGSLTPASFELNLVDGDPGHSVVTAVVEARPFRPVGPGAPGEPPLPVAPAGVEWVTSGSTSSEEQRIQNYRLSRDAGFVVWDWSGARAGVHFQAPSATGVPGEYRDEYVALFGPDRGHVLLGGAGPNVLEGGMESDVLVAGSSQNTLSGRAGADRFVAGWVAGGQDLVLDFSVAEGDVLDLSRLLAGTSPVLSDYLRVRADGSDVVLEVDAAGRGGPYTDRSIRLVGVDPGSVDLSAWLDEGRLITAGVGLPPRISVVATRGRTGESEAEPGEFVLTRTGPDTSALEVMVAISGSALNGVDYAAIGDRVTFGPGVRRVRVLVQPFPDSQPEPVETVEMVLQSGAGYALGEADRARVSIADWQSTVSLSALAPFATLQPLQPGAFRITSALPVDRVTEVVLTVGGSAEPGVHYQPLRRTVTLAPGQSSVTVDIVPIPGASLRGGAASVEVSLAEDPAYRVGASGSVRILVVDRIESFATWRSRNFPDNRETLAVFGGRDPGSLGVPLLARYAYGLDPNQPDLTRVPRPRLSDGFLTLDVPRRAAASDLEFVVEVSSDLIHWETSTTRVQEVRGQGDAADPAMLCYRAVPSVLEAPRQFMRVRILHRP